MTVWNILQTFGIINSLWSFGTFFPFWYVWSKKNLATLRQQGFDKRRALFTQLREDMNMNAKQKVLHRTGRSPGTKYFVKQCFRPQSLHNKFYIREKNVK
jgi:hypothetical protein